MENLEGVMAVENWEGVMLAPPSFLPLAVSVLFAAAAQQEMDLAVVD